MKKISIISILGVLLCCSCNRIGIGVGVVVDGETVKEGASFIGNNIGNIILIIFCILIVLFIIVGIILLISNSDSGSADGAKNGTSEYEIRKEIIDTVEKRKKFFDEVLSSNADVIKFNNAVISNCRNKMEAIIKDYPAWRQIYRNKSYSSYQHYLMSTNSEFLATLFDDNTLKGKHRNNLDKEQDMVLTAFIKKNE